MTDTNIAFQISRISNNIDNAYKGATMPATNNSAMLADTINSISGGGGGYQEVGKYMIDANGMAVVQAGDINGRFAGITVVNNSVLQSAFVNSNLSGNANFSSLTEVRQSGMQGCFSGCKSLTGLNYPSLTTIGQSGMAHCHTNCTNIVGDVDLHSLTSIGAYGLEWFFGSGYTPTMNVGKNASVNLSSVSVLNNTNAMHSFFMYRGDNTTVDMSSLTVVNGSSAMDSAYSQSGIVSINLSSLTTVNGSSAMNQCFYGCNQLTVLNLPSLTDVSGLNPMLGFASYSQNLTTVELNAIVNVGDNGMRNSFFQCPNLNTVTVGEYSTEEAGSFILQGTGSEMNFGNYAFFQAFAGTNFTTVQIEADDMVLHTSTFSGMFRDCPRVGFAFLRIPNVPTNACSNMFRNNPSLTSITVATGQITANGCANMCADCTSLSVFQLDPLESDVAVEPNGLAGTFQNTAIEQFIIGASKVTTNAGATPFNGIFNGLPLLTLDLSYLIAENGQDDVFGGILTGTDGVTVTFAADMQTEVETWASYQANFGGTNVLVEFN